MDSCRFSLACCIMGVEILKDLVRDRERLSAKTVC